MELICGNWICDSWHYSCSSGVDFNGKLSIWLQRRAHPTFLIKNSLLVVGDLIQS